MKIQEQLTDYPFALNVIEISIKYPINCNGLCKTQLQISFRSLFMSPAKS